MFRVRKATGIDDFVGAPDDPDDYRDTIRSLWESGESKPEWAFVVEDSSEVVGRIGFMVTPTVSDPSWLGSLPANELFVYGLHLPWQDEFETLGRLLLAEGSAAIADEVPHLLEVRLNNSVHPFVDQRRQLMNSLGFNLFQEKYGFTWTDDGGRVATSSQLSFQTIEETGLGLYRSTMAPCGEGTIDRNDRYYWEGCGPENWAAQMTEYYDDKDSEMWLIGLKDDRPVGYVAVSRDDEWGATVAHIGVLPQHRGRGHVHDLLAAGTNAARDAGISTMLSDVDVLNHPMTNAMERAGHRKDPDRWHVWVYRTDLTALGSRAD